MRIETKMMLVAGLVALLAAADSYAAEQFDLRDAGIETVDETISFQLTENAIIATLTGDDSVAGDDEELNRTAGGFGVNSPSGGDVSNFLDGDIASESVIITFNLPVSLDQLQLSSFSGSETATLTINGFTPVTLNALGAANDIYNFTTDNTVGTSSSITLEWASGNGFSFDNFTVSVVPTPAALPAGLALIGFIAARRRR